MQRLLTEWLVHHSTLSASHNLEVSSHFPTREKWEGLQGRKKDDYRRLCDSRLTALAQWISMYYMRYFPVTFGLISKGRQMKWLALIWTMVFFLSDKLIYSTYMHKIKNLTWMNKRFTWIMKCFWKATVHIQLHIW